jgi:hypothetical protein
MRRDIWNWATKWPIVHPQDNTWVNTEQWWNDTGKGKPKDLEKKSLNVALPTQKKSHIHCTGREPWPA